MAVDLSDDLGYVDGLETVTFQRYSLAGVLETSYANVSALRRVITGVPTTIGPHGAQTPTPTNAMWHVVKETLAVSPRRGDRIVSGDSGTWVVEWVDEATLSTRYAVKAYLKL